MTGRAVFLDRDGVLNVDRSDYVKRWEEFTFVPGTLDALRVLAALPVRVAVVTNQSCVGRGLVTAGAVADVHRRMCEEVAAAGGRIDGIFLCPHAPGEGCACRKPKPGLLRAAAVDLDVDLARSWFVGDSTRDLDAARAVGAEPILVLTGHGETAREAAEACATKVVPDLSAAVAYIRGTMAR